MTGFMAIDTHVDDGMGICSSEGEESRLKHGIQKFYKIKEKDTSKPFKVLGILVTRDTHCRTLKLSQADYMDRMLHRFKMSNCNPVATPVDKGAHLQDEESAIFESKKTFQATHWILDLCSNVYVSRHKLHYSVPFPSERRTQAM